MKNFTACPERRLQNLRIAISWMITRLRTLLDLRPTIGYNTRIMDAGPHSSISAQWMAFADGMRPDGSRVREAILHLIYRAEQLGFAITQYDILKSLFFADKSHLNKYRRPITFDQYYALPDGPVPSLSYDLLKEALQAFRAVGVDEALWRTEPSDGKSIQFIGAIRDGSEDYLSQSDFEELDAAQDRVRELGFGKVWKATHSDPAYIKAWDQRGEGKRFPMRYEDLLERPDPRLISDLAFVTGD